MEYCSRSRAGPRRLQAVETQSEPHGPHETPTALGPCLTLDSALLLPVSPHTEPGLSPAGPAAPTCSPSWTWLASQHPSSAFILAQGGAKHREKGVHEASSWAVGVQEYAGSWWEETHCPICHPSATARGARRSKTQHNIRTRVSERPLKPRVLWILRE